MDRLSLELFSWIREGHLAISANWLCPVLKGSVSSTPCLLFFFFNFNLSKHLPQMVQKRKEAQIPNPSLVNPPPWGRNYKGLP